MSLRVLLTGSTGNVGRQILSQLRQREVLIRIGSQHADTSGVVAYDAANGAETVYLDLSQRSSYAKAVQDCDTVFLLRPPAVANTKETLNVFIDSARNAGVRRTVFLSVAGAGDNRIFPHHAVEQKLKEQRDDWTILRPGFFAQNLETAYRRDIIDDDRIYVPAGKGLVAWIDLRDVGVVGAETLVDLSKHAGKTYTLTGPSAYPFTQVAELLSQAVGRPIRYDAASIPGYFWHLRRSGVGAGQAFVQLVLHVGLRFGQAETVDPTLERLLGRRGYSVEEYIRDHAELWMKEEPSRASA